MISLLLKRLGKYKVKLIYFIMLLAIGFLIVLLLSGKSNENINAIAISSDEEYVAFFKTGRGHIIYCYDTRGSLMFQFNIPSAFDAGGHCSLWFDSDNLCAYFFRTKITAYFSLDGSVVNTIENTMEQNPTKYPSFSRKNGQYVFKGAEIDVTYNTAGVSYWLLGKDRYLKITSKNGETRMLLSWDAKGQEMD